VLPTDGPDDVSLNASVSVVGDYHRKVISTVAPLAGINLSVSITYYENEELRYVVRCMRSATNLDLSAVTVH
jgi:hypothetical protein